MAPSMNRMRLLRNLDLYLIDNSSVEMTNNKNPIATSVPIENAPNIIRGMNVPVTNQVASKKSNDGRRVDSVLSTKQSIPSIAQ